MTPLRLLVGLAGRGQRAAEPLPGRAPHPTTVRGDAVVTSEPQLDWETRAGTVGVLVDEGPAALLGRGRSMAARPGLPTTRWPAPKAAAARTARSPRSRSARGTGGRPEFGVPSGRTAEIPLPAGDPGP